MQLLSSAAFYNTEDEVLCCEVRPNDVVRIYGDLKRVATAETVATAKVWLGQRSPFAVRLVTTDGYEGFFHPAQTIPSPFDEMEGMPLLAFAFDDGLLGEGCRKFVMAQPYPRMVGSND